MRGRKERLIKNLLSKFRRQCVVDDVGGKPIILFRRMLLDQSKNMLNKGGFFNMFTNGSPASRRTFETRASGEEHSDPAGTSLVKRRQESLVASPLLQRKSARRLINSQAYNMKGQNNFLRKSIEMLEGRI